jgi:hypothetical protein
MDVCLLCVITKPRPKRYEREGHSLRWAAVRENKNK